ncbi:MAG: RNA methyltransferase [Chlamydiota bacterium]
MSAPYKYDPFEPMLAKVIESAQHRLIKHIVKLRNDSGYRYRLSTLFIEGKKLVFEVANTKKIRRLFLRKNTPIPSEIRYQELYFLNDRLFKKIASTQSPEPFAAEIDLPKEADLSEKQRLLVLDKVTDPGNVGTLIRTALALSFDGIFLTTGSADLFNDKALRAAKGATFHLAYTRGDTQKLLTLASRFQLYVGDREGISLSQLTFSRPLILALGNESQGASEEIKQVGTCVSIPLSLQTDSLNVASAGAILMHTIREQLWPN